MFRRLIFLLLAILVLVSVASPVYAQAARLTVNHVGSKDFPEVAVNVSLLGPDGRALGGVTADQFVVTEEGQQQPVSGIDIGTARAIPVSLVLTIDVSGSMAGDKLQQAKAAAIQFLESMREFDRYTLVAFSDAPRVVVPATSDRAALEAGINGLQPAGNTAAYDALYMSAEQLAKEPIRQRRIIVLLSDGADTASNHTARVAADVARQSDALVYAIGLGPDAVDAVLTDLSEPTGGKYYKAPSSTDLAAIFQSISLELSSQIIVRYTTANRTTRAYQFLTVNVRYTGPDGQTVDQTVRYRPPASSIIVPTPAPVATLPAAESVVVPPVIESAPPEAVTTAPSEDFFRFASIAGGLLASIAVLLLLAGLATQLGPSPASLRLARYTGGAVHTDDEQEVRAPGFMRRVIGPLIESLGRRLGALSPKGYTDNLQNMILLMGPPYRVRVATILGLQFALAILLAVPMFFWALRTSPDAPMRWFLAVALGIMIGLYIPYFWLARRVSRRRQALIKALPAALDFLAINVEAGMGFDAALAEVVKRWRNALVDEFGLLLIDFQIGKPRKDAWRDLIRRTQIPDLTAFVTAMLQNEQVGASIGNLLRTQAEHMRIKRRQRAEEAARVAPVKMLLPMVFFIFPGILVVVLGPAIPQFIETFGDLNR